MEATANVCFNNYEEIEREPEPWVRNVYFARKIVENQGTTVRFERITSSILGKTVYLIVETEDLQDEQLRISIRSRESVLGGGDLQMMYFDHTAGSYTANTVIEKTVGNFDDLNNNQDSHAHYTNLDDHTSKVIIKVQLRPDNRATFNNWATAINQRTERTADLSVRIEKPGGSNIYFGADREEAVHYVFLDTDGGFTVENKNFYEIYHRDNAYNFLSMNGNTRRKVGELRSFYMNGITEVSITSNTNYYFYDDFDNEIVIAEDLVRNQHGLIQFPANGNGFGRYGTIDAGGQSMTPQETVGQGDHYLLPKTIAALFGVTREIFSRGWRIDFGDMSSENGSDPWQTGQLHHGGHGHLGRRTGLDVDLRYLDRNGISFQGNYRTYPNFDTNNNSLVFQIAFDYGFSTNYATGQNTYAGVNPTIPGHEDHGHWGFDINSVHTII